MTTEQKNTVTVNFTSNNVWPLPYEIDWQAPTPANEVSQAVDGHWEVTPDGLHTVTTGYDRLVAIGDTTWDDYEVTVPVTIHGYGGGSGIGVLLRWMGHTDFPVSCTQPKCGYLPLGAICWYRGNRLEIYGNDGDILATQTRSLDLETTYIFKARVETNPGVGGQYSFKVWNESEMEPDGWDITAQEAMSDPQNGSLMLISHHGDVTYGNLSVSPIPISITNVHALVNSGNTSATISWNTSVPANSQVAYGLTTAYELDTITDLTLETSHSMDLTGLLPDTEYHYQIRSITAEEDTAFTGDMTFTTVTSDIVSDDFHLPMLNTSLWTFVDPVGDCGYNLVGSNTTDAWLNFQVPAGTEHQLWTSGLKVPHVLQNCNNADFELEVKFESPLNLQYQQQGILVREDDDIFMRFEFFSKGSETHIYLASFISGSVTTHADIVIGTTGMTPLFMRVKRQNNQWITSHSIDGISWTQSAIFTFSLTVTGVGPYAGNAVGGSSPAHTGSIDYFFNTASPVDPEDPVSAGVVTITSTPISSAIIGQLYAYDVEAAGTPAPTYTLLISPTGMTIDSNSGLIEWTPDSTGDFNVSVQASNPNPSFDIQNFVIHVADTAEGAISDDFNDPTLDTNIWTFIDPLEDGGYTLTGTCTNDAWINISVPGGSPHELWEDGIMVPHIIQPSGDTDFELEVKFESSLSGAFQEQGILVKQDSANFIRFEFYSSASNTNVIAATLTAGSPTVFPLTDLIKFNGPIGIPGIAPLYMRVNRTGNQWTQSYSTDSINWNVATTFAHTLVVTAVGTYAGNAGSSPSHTSSVDYFFNIAAPVSPEDAPCIHSITTGAITGSPFIAGSSLSVPFTISGTFNSENIFTAQLSDETGSFLSPVSIGTLTGTSAGTIPATVPGDATSGTAYRIRVIASDPSTTGTDNGADLTINAIPAIDIAVYNTNCGDFEVKLIPRLNITDNYLTNLQFTIKWPANKINLVNFSTTYGVALQGTVNIENDTNYAVFVSTSNQLINWDANTEYTILSFSHDNSNTGYADFLIDTVSWATNNNGEYYIELLGLDYTGIVLENANNVYLGMCGNIRAMLQGPYKGGGLMTKDLAGNIPLAQPYGVAPWNYPGTEELFEIDTNAVDWVLLELRSNPTTTIEKKVALLMEDGSIVQYNNTSQGVHFDNSDYGSSHYIVVHHRNHMPVMTLASTLFDGTLVDFTDETICYGTPNAEIELETGIYGMIAGDINSNGYLSYSGPDNDRGLILARIVSELNTTNVNDTVIGYFDEDVLMDYQIKYIGANNDRSIILTNLSELTGTVYLNAFYQSEVPSVTNKSESINDGPIHIFLAETKNEIQVKIMTDETIQDGIVDNVQFTLSWEVAASEIIVPILENLQGTFGLMPQGEVTNFEGKMHQVFVSVVPVALPNPFDKNAEVVLVSFNKNKSVTISSAIRIANNAYTETHNGVYYISLLGTDFTGTIKTTSLGLADLENLGLSIYPNPVTSGVVHVDMNLEKAQDVTISVMDIQGKIIKSDKLHVNEGFSNNRIDLHTISKGIYYIKVQADGLNASYKLILL